MSPRPQSMTQGTRGARGTLGTMALVAVGVMAVSVSGPLMAAMVVPPLAIAFWRNAMATLALAPSASSTHRHEISGLGRRQFGWIAASGLALAIHFGTWVTSLTLTTVASATALVCLQLGWVVAWQSLRGERPNAGVFVGLLTAFVGVVVVSGVDFTVSPQALLGDVLALVGGMTAAAYVVLGSHSRQTVSTTSYTFVCYGTCAALLLLACLVSGQELLGYDGTQWALLVAVTVTAQLMGHSVFNHLLATTRPMVLSLALLLEVPGAALLAAWFLGQQPPAGALVGLAVILAGMACVIVNSRESDVERAVQAPMD